MSAGWLDKALVSVPGETKSFSVDVMVRNDQVDQIYDFGEKGKQWTSKAQTILLSLIILSL